MPSHPLLCCTLSPPHLPQLAEVCFEPWPACLPHGNLIAAFIPVSSITLSLCSGTHPHPTAPGTLGGFFLGKLR